MSMSGCPALAVDDSIDRVFRPSIPAADLGGAHTLCRQQANQRDVFPRQSLPRRKHGDVFVWTRLPALNRADVRLRNPEMLRDLVLPESSACGPNCLDLILRQFAVRSEMLHPRHRHEVIGIDTVFGFAGVVQVVTRWNGTVSLFPPIAMNPLLSSIKSNTCIAVFCEPVCPEMTIGVGIDLEPIFEPEFVAMTNDVSLRLAFSKTAGCRRPRGQLRRLAASTRTQTELNRGIFRGHRSAPNTSLLSRRRVPSGGGFSLEELYRVQHETG